MSEERLKRIEVLLETCAKMTVEHQHQIQELTQTSSQASEQIQELTQKSSQASEQIIQLTLHMGTLSQLFAENMTVIKNMQSEIKDIQLEVKGLQTENKRILDHLFGESQN
jgi:predicted  nucleic acid-binding Zn-ribbon protein